MSVTYDDSVGVEVSSDSFWEVMPMFSPPWCRDQADRLFGGQGWGYEMNKPPKFFSQAFVGSRYSWAISEGRELTLLEKSDAQRG